MKAVFADHDITGQIALEILSIPPSIKRKIKGNMKEGNFSLPFKRNLELCDTKVT